MSINGTDLKTKSGVGWKKLQTHVNHPQLGGSDAALIVSSFQTLAFYWFQWCHITGTEDEAGVSAGRLLFRKQVCKCSGLRSCPMNWIRFGSATVNEKIWILLGKQSFCSFRVSVSATVGFQQLHEINSGRRFKLAQISVLWIPSAMEIHVCFSNMLGKKRKEAKINKTCCV